MDWLISALKSCGSCKLQEVEVIVEGIVVVEMEW